MKSFQVRIPNDDVERDEGDQYEHALIVDLQECPRPIGFLSVQVRGDHAEEMWFSPNEAEQLYVALEGALAAYETYVSKVHDVVRADRIVELLERNTQRRIHGFPVPRHESTELLGLVLADKVADAA